MNTYLKKYSVRAVVVLAAIAAVLVTTARAADETQPASAPAPVPGNMRLTLTGSAVVGFTVAPASQPATSSQPTTTSQPAANRPAGSPPALQPVANPGAMVAGRVQVFNVRVNGGGVVVQDPSQAQPQPAPVPATGPAVAPEKVTSLLPQLDNDDFKQRDAAQKALSDMGPGVVPVIKDILAKNKDLSMEVKTRLEQVVSVYQPATPATPRPVGMGFKDRGGRIQPLPPQAAK